MPDIVSLGGGSGSQGTQGTQGTQGAQGAQGTQGTQGSAGSGGASGFYRTLLNTFALVSASAASGTKYVFRNGNADVTTYTTSTGLLLVDINATDLAATGFTSKLRLKLIVKTGTAPAVTITAGLYPLTSGGSSNLGTVIAASTVAAASPAGSTETAYSGSDFDLPTDGIYGLGYTVSGTPAGTVSLQAVLQTRHV